MALEARPHSAASVWWMRGATEAAELEVGGAVVEIALKRHTESFMHSIFLFIIISAKAELWV